MRKITQRWLNQSHTYFNIIVIITSLFMRKAQS
jgi:hypothetical protein